LRGQVPNLREVEGSDPNLREVEGPIQTCGRLRGQVPNLREGGGFRGGGSLSKAVASTWVVTRF